MPEEPAWETRPVLAAADSDPFLLRHAGYWPRRAMFEDGAQADQVSLGQEARALQVRLGVLRLQIRRLRPRQAELEQR
eukprot:1552545-Alexandrium_andersonii.AAC.1